MTPAAAAILEGMPDPRDLRRVSADGQTLISAGSRLLFRYRDGDAGARNVAVAVLRQLGYGGQAVAAVMGLTVNYVATLHNRALREGTGGVVRPRGRPGKAGQESWDRARQWRAAGVRDAEIARRLQVNQSTVLRHLGPAAAQGQLPLEQDAAEPAPGVPQPPRPGSGPVPEAGPGREGAPEPGPGACTGRGACPGRGGHGGGGSGDGMAAAGPGIAGQVASRYAGAMLLHAFAGRAGAGEILAAAAGGQPAGVALLSAVSMCFALGAATLEQFKHLAAADAGPLAGLGALPDLRTIRPRLAAIADGTDPVAVQRLFASAMLAADPVLSGVYYVDDHFVPYAGAKPVAKGWNNKRGKAERGRADTHVTAHDGRAVCFVTGEPSGLTTTLPKALADLTNAAGLGAQIMVGFDRGGAYAQVFRHCRDQQVHWVTYRRAPLAVRGPDAMSDTDSIARLGRAVAVTLIAATQRPTQKAMGQGAVRSQMDLRICFRVRERKDVDLVLGQGMLRAGWDAHNLNAPGKFLISAPEHDTPKRARAYLLTDQVVADTGARYANNRPELDAESQRSIDSATQPQAPSRESGPAANSQAMRDAAETTD